MKHRNESILEEMKGVQRIFRIDRDTLIVYTGKNGDEIAPFLRIGAGDDIPHGLLRHIETVIVPDSQIWNLGLETAWQEATLAQGARNILYVGDRDKISKIYAYTWIDIDQEELHKEKVKIRPIQKNSVEGDRTDKSYIVFMNNGNLVLNVYGTKVLDHSAYYRGKISIDREYDLIARAQAKAALRANAGVGFVYLGTENGTLPSLYWNFDGNGLLCNPQQEYHNALYENGIGVERVNMVLSDNAQHAGFVEAIRRKNAESKPVGLYAPQQDKISALGKIYNNAKLLGFDDSRTLPFYQNAVFFLSRSGSHGLFSIKPEKSADNHIQILFPVRKRAKESRAFDYTRGPYDLEIAAIHSKGDLELGDALLKLHFPGSYPSASYLRSAINEGVYPLLLGSEYRFFNSDVTAEIIQSFLSVLSGTEYGEAIDGLFNYFSGQPGNEGIGNLYDLFSRIKKIKVKPDLILKINLFEAFRFMRTSEVFMKLKPMQKRAFERLQSRYTPRRHKIRELYALPSRYLEFTAIFFRGRRAYLTVRRHKPDPVELRFPPDVTQFEETRQAYRTYLKQQNKILDRSSEDVAAYRSGLEMMEKIFEERAAMFEERKRLSLLLDELGLALYSAPEQRGGLRLPAFIPAAIRLRLESIDFGGMKNSVLGRIRPFVESLRDLKAAFFAIPIALLLGSAIFYSASRFFGSASETAEAGAKIENGVPSSAESAGEGGGFLDSLASLLGFGGVGVERLSEADIEAIHLVPPGDVQVDLRVPGETDVIIDPIEIMAYANSLAEKNGFAKIKEPPEGRRDPELIFPDDRLKLADGRIVQITPGDTIWRISIKHYRKDFARIILLKRYIQELSQSDEKKKWGDWRAV
jgi:hypothetical protein